jgi:hypothetical protein
MSANRLFHFMTETTNSESPVSTFFNALASNVTQTNQAADDSRRVDKLTMGIEVMVMAVR